jgi:hypothetical protein
MILERRTPIGDIFFQLSAFTHSSLIDLTTKDGADIWIHMWFAEGCFFVTHARM